MILSRKNQPRRGATLVEFAFVAVLFVMVMFGILEFCLIVYTYNIVENAAREGARYGVVNVTDSTMVNDTKNHTKSYMANLDTKMKNYACNVYRSDSKGANLGAATDAQFGQYICVDVAVDYTPITPGLGYLKSFTLRSKCIMASEAN